MNVDGRVVLLSVFSMFPTAFVSADELDVVRQMLMENIRLLSTIHYDATIRNSDGTVSQVSAFHDGVRYRLERRDTRIARRLIAKGHNKHFRGISAFDGEKYQWFDQRSGLLRIEASPPPDLFSNPLFVSYYWLTVGADGASETPTWASLRDAEVWTKRFREATLDNMDDGLVVICFPQENLEPPCYFKVFYDPDKRYSPVKYERYVTGSPATLTTIFQVHKGVSVDVDGTPIFLPLNIEYEEFGEDGLSYVMNQKVDVDPLSVRVNVPLDPDLFTVSPSPTSQVYNVQAQHDLLLGENENNNHSHVIAPWIVSQICVAAAVLASVLVFAFLKKKRT